MSLGEKESCSRMEFDVLVSALLFYEIAQKKERKSRDDLIKNYCVSLELHHRGLNR